MILQYMPMTPPARENMFLHIRGLVARVLLEQTGDSTGERHRMTQRDIAERVNADWDMVHMSFKSMQDEGAIRIEGHRLIINKELLQKLTGI